ncbi:MAG TPA: 4Fe-4S binding protein, partial [Solirubrobacteraceae bacterium]|nr:4Fe-4S binding protein [Solirubrobacteraceae bacterium]
AGRPQGAGAALPGGAVEPGLAPVPRTGGWRSGARPSVDMDACVNFLLCWIYSPDSAGGVHDGTLQEIDYDVCKGCEICAEMCPVGAIEMVGE